MRDGLASPIAVQELEEEHFHRGDRTQFPLSPRMAYLLAGSYDRVVLQLLTPIPLELTNDPCDVPKHCRPPCERVCFVTHRSTEARLSACPPAVLRQRCLIVAGQNTATILMPFGISPIVDGDRYSRS